MSDTRIPPILRGGRGVLLFNHQGLGDAVQTIPLIRALCSWSGGRWPVRVLFRSRSYFEVVQEEGFKIEPFFLLPDYAGKKGLAQLYLDFRGTTDLVVCPPELSALKLIVVQRLLNARYSLGEAEVPLARLLSFAVERDWNKSFLKTQEELAAKIGIETPLNQPRITLRPDEIRWARHLLCQSGVKFGDALIGLHCSSTVPEKKWPAAYFGRVTDNLRQMFPNMNAVSFGSEEDRTAAGEAQLAAGRIRWIEGAGRWTVRQTLAMLSHCHLLISGDTGVMHMAAAVGTRTVSIFGPTSPHRRAPLEAGGIAVAPQTSCHPCFRLKWNGCRCIQTIGVHRVTAAAQRSLLGRCDALATQA